MRSLLVIGIGAGDPDFVTVQAVDALNRVDVFFVLDKPDSSAAATDLNAARAEVCERHIHDRDYRTVVISDPPRQRHGDDYVGDVDDWRHRRGAAVEQALAGELADGETGGFLVWGDPSLYDGTIRVLEEITARGRVAFDFEVVPGISSVHALTARHRLMLNRVGRPVLVTTGRRLAEGLPDDVDDIVVMLDADLACKDIAPDAAADIDIFWGAYLGTADELLVSGPLPDVIGEIERVRGAARERKGWIMDTYLLRRRASLLQ